MASRVSGLLIVAAVIAGWERGYDISDPGVLILLAIAAALLGIDLTAVLRRNGKNGTGSG